MNKVRIVFTSHSEEKGPVTPGAVPSMAPVPVIPAVPSDSPAGKTAGSTVDKEKIAKLRMSWRRVSRKVLASKNEDTRKRWSKQLGTIAQYMMRKVKELFPGKLTAKKKLYKDFFLKEIDLYKRMATALNTTVPAKGDVKLADIRIARPEGGKPAKAVPQKRKTPTADKVTKTTKIVRSKKAAAGRKARKAVPAAAKKRTTRAAKAAPPARAKRKKVTVKGIG